MPSVAFYPRAKAQLLRPGPTDVLISIHDADQEPAVLQDGWRDVLRLSFHDIDIPKEGFDLFHASQAEEVIAFATKYATVEHIYVHCNMGASRSAGIALFLAKWQNRTLYQEGQVCRAPPNLYNRAVHRVLMDAWLGPGPSAFEMDI